MSDWITQLTEDAHEVIKSHDSLSVGAREYLSWRGVSEQAIMEHKVGLALPATVKLPTCTKEFAPWSEKWLWNNLVFPLYSTQGHVIGMQTATIPPAPRSYQQFYLYPQLLFPYLFGLPQALPTIFETAHVVVVEGVFDYFAVRQVLPNVVAQLTAGTPRAVKRFFKRYAKCVIVLTDMDDVGRQAAVALQESKLGIQVRVPTYSEKDPNEMLRKGKMTELYQVINRATL